MNSNSSKIDVMEERVCNMIKTNNSDHAEILKKIEEINSKLDHNFVPISRFTPIEKIVYGMTTLILVAVLGAIIRQVIK